MRLTRGAIGVGIVVSLLISGTACSTPIPPTTAASESSRLLGAPAQDKLNDLNKWLSNVAVISGDVSFESRSPALSPAGEEILRSLVPHLEEMPGTILIEGYADGVGGDGSQNDTLSTGRAESVKAWLIGVANIPADRFLPVIGHGTRDLVNGVAAQDGIEDPLRRVVQVTVGSN